MAVVARGTFEDRPFAKTIVAIAARRFTGDFLSEVSGKRYRLTWRDGVVIDAESPSATDSPARVALTAGLVTSTQLGDYARAQAAAPQTDPVELLVQLARLSPEQADLVRRRTLAHRAVRIFALEGASFILDDEPHAAGPSLFAPPPLDARWLVYHGVRAHYSDARLSRELERLAGAQPFFLLGEAGLAQLPTFGFGEAERPLLHRLQQPTSLQEVIAGGVGVELKTALAMLYALAASGCVELVTAAAMGATRAPHTGSASRPIFLSNQAAAPATPAAAPDAAARSRSRTTPLGGERARPGTGGHRPRRESNLVAHAYELPMSGRARPPSAAPIGSAAGAPPAASAARSPAPAASHASGSSTSLPAAPRPSHSDSSLRITTAIRTKSQTGRHIPQGPEAVRLLIKGGLQKIDGGADHFALLGVAPGAGADQIRNAYFELARQLHPDRIRALHIDDLAREAQRLFAQINTAFAILSNPKRHAEYVTVLHAGGEKVMRARQEEAEQVALRLLQAEDHFRRGEMALRRHQFSDAVADFKKSVELNPAEGEHHAALAWATWCSAPDKTKVSVEVRKGLDKGMELSPNSPAPYLYRGRIAKSEGRDDAALQNFEKVLELAPGNVDAEAEVRLLQSRRAKQDPSTKGGGLFGRFKR